MWKEKVLTNALGFVSGKIYAVLKRTIEFGVAYHNSEFNCQREKIIGICF